MSNFTHSRTLLLALLATACSNDEPAKDIRQPASPTVVAAPVATPPAMGSAEATLVVTNLTENQEITEGTPVLFRITGTNDIQAVQVTSNGKAIGDANTSPEEHRFETSFSEPGEFVLEFNGFAKDKSKPAASAIYRVRVVAKPLPPPPAARNRLFNDYVLKAVAQLNQKYGLLGYNIRKQFTHEIPFHKGGTLRPTGGGQTMCVAGILEVILTAFDIYAKETGNYSHYDFLPFSSWSTLKPGSIKASIWVNPKLKSSGTGDALANFGIGERVKFRDLEPGGFININRTTRTGHAVVFLSFIDIKGRELPRYSAEVAGFKYFGAQGRSIKGQGGFDYRYAFFSKRGCPKVPFKRDCNVIFSDDPRLLNVGQLLAPQEWKRVSPSRDASFEVEEENNLTVSPAGFDGLTTDD